MKEEEREEDKGRRGGRDGESDDEGDDIPPPLTLIVPKERRLGDT